MIEPDMRPPQLDLEWRRPAGADHPPVPKILSAMISAGLTAGAVLGAAAPAEAALQTFGSSLAAPADVTIAHQADTAFLPTSFASGAGIVVPESGQIRTVRLKGKANSHPLLGRPGGETMWHLQALRRQPDGSMRILRSSQALFVPHTGDPQQISSYEPTSFCVDAGDVLAFNTVGGWDGILDQTGPHPGGTPLQIFSRTPGSNTAWFEAADKTNNGDLITPTMRGTTDTELLMQAVVGTTTDAVTHCPGGRIASDGSILPEGGFAAKAQLDANAKKTAMIQKARAPKQRVTVARSGKFVVSMLCSAGFATNPPCTGTVQVRTRGRKPVVPAKQVKFSIKAKRNARITLRLNAAGKRAFRKAKRKLPVSIVAVTAPGTKARTTTFEVTLRPRGGR